MKVKLVVAMQCLRDPDWTLSSGPLTVPSNARASLFLLPGFLLHISRTQGRDVEEREHEICFRYVHSSPVGKIAECNEKK